jgi:hypothetical protein
MKIMLRAAIAALSIASIGPALADGGEGARRRSPGSGAECPGICAERPSGARIWRLQHPVGPRHVAVPAKRQCGRQQLI